MEMPSFTYIKNFLAFFTDWVTRFLETVRDNIPQQTITFGNAEDDV